MNQDTQETQTQTWEESHPWLSQLTEKDDEDTVGEVINPLMTFLPPVCLPRRIRLTSILEIPIFCASWLPDQ